MMNLILWRHAEAEECVDPAHDHKRKLTTRGEKQAARMARWLDRQLPQSARIWASPAVRAEQTALALGRPYKVCPELAPDTDITPLLERMQWPRSNGYLVLVGHQPALSLVIGSLLGVSADLFSVKKGAIWWLRYKEHPLPGRTVLLAVQTPDTL